MGIAPSRDANIDDEIRRQGNIQHDSRTQQPDGSRRSSRASSPSSPAILLSGEREAQANVQLPSTPSAPQLQAVIADSTLMLATFASDTGSEANDSLSVGRPQRSDSQRFRRADAATTASSAPRATKRRESMPHSDVMTEMNDDDASTEAPHGAVVPIEKWPNIALSLDARSPWLQEFLVPEIELKYRSTAVKERARTQVIAILCLSIGVAAIGSWLYISTWAGPLWVAIGVVCLLWCPCAGFLTLSGTESRRFGAVCTNLERAHSLLSKPQRDAFLFYTPPIAGFLLAGALSVTVEMVRETCASRYPSTGDPSADSEAQEIRNACAESMFPHTMFILLFLVMLRFELRQVVWIAGAIPAAVALGRIAVAGASTETYLITIGYNVMVAALVVPLLRRVNAQDRDKFKENVMALHHRETALRVRAQLDETLRSLVPAHTFARLEANQPVLDVAAMSTVSVCEIFDFVKWTSSVLPAVAVQAINALVCGFDIEAEKTGVARLRVFGDQYIAGVGIGVGGENEEAAEANSAFLDPNHVAVHVGGGRGMGSRAGTHGSSKRKTSDDPGVLLQFAAKCHRLAAVLNQQLRDAPISLRIGCHSGASFAGLVGAHTITYDVFGPAIKGAAEIVRLCPSRAVYLSEATMQQVDAQQYVCTVVCGKESQCTPEASASTAQAAAVRSVRPFAASFETAAQVFKADVGSLGASVEGNVAAASLPSTVHVSSGTGPGAVGRDEVVVVFSLTRIILNARRRGSRVRPHTPSAIARRSSAVSGGDLSENSSMNKTMLTTATSFVPSSASTKVPPSPSARSSAAVNPTALTSARTSAIINEDGPRPSPAMPVFSDIEQVVSSFDVGSRSGSTQTTEPHTALERRMDLPDSPTGSQCRSPSDISNPLVAPSSASTMLQSTGDEAPPQHNIKDAGESTVSNDSFDSNSGRPEGSSRFTRALRRRLVDAEVVAQRTTSATLDGITSGEDGTVVGRDYVASVLAKLRDVTWDCRFRDRSMEASFLRFAARQESTDSTYVNAALVLIAVASIGCRLVETYTTQRRDLAGGVSTDGVGFGLLSAALAVALARLALRLRLRASPEIVPRGELALFVLCVWGMYGAMAAARDSAINRDFEYAFEYFVPVFCIACSRVPWWAAVGVSVVGNVGPYFVASYARNGRVFISSGFIVSLTAICGFVMSRMRDQHQRLYFSNSVSCDARLRGAEDELAMQRALLKMIVPVELVPLFATGVTGSRLTSAPRVGFFMEYINDVVAVHVRLDGLTAHVNKHLRAPGEAVAAIERVFYEYESVLARCRYLRRVQSLGDTLLLAGPLTPLLPSVDSVPPGPQGHASSIGRKASPAPSVRSPHQRTLESVMDSQLSVKVAPQGEVSLVFQDPGDSVCSDDGRRADQRTGSRHPSDGQVPCMDPLVQLRRDFESQVTEAALEASELLAISAGFTCQRTAVAVVGSAFAAIIGGSTASFELIGEAVRRSMAIVHAAPSGFAGATESFMRQLPKGSEGAARFCASPAKWRIRGAGSVFIHTVIAKPQELVDGDDSFLDGLGF